MTALFDVVHQISLKYGIRIKAKGRACQTEDALDCITRERCTTWVKDLGKWLSLIMYVLGKQENLNSDTQRIH